MIYTSVLYLGISGTTLLFLVLLFAVESKRKYRILFPNTRAKLDSFVLSVYSYIARFYYHVGTGSVRMAFHYLTHCVLGVFLNFLDFIETYVEKLRYENRNTVRTIQSAKEKTHLDIITEHRAQVSLSTVEKNKLRQKSIEGRI